MKLTTALLPLASLLITATNPSAVAAATNPPSKYPPNPVNHAEARKICNRLPTQARREICLRAIADPRHPPRHSERDGGPAGVDALSEYHSVGIGEHDDGSLVAGEHEGMKDVKLPNGSPDQWEPWVWVPDEKREEVHPSGEDWMRAAVPDNVKEKRDVEVTEEGDGVLDLAIPVRVPGRPIVEYEHAHARATVDANAMDIAIPPPTTFQTLPLTSTPAPAPTGPPPITYEEVLTLAASPTFAVHKSIQTATPENGTEVRLEQTESQTHEVHLEETERKKGAQEEDKVVVHVKVFVEHLREKAQRMKRGIRG